MTYEDDAEPEKRDNSNVDDGVPSATPQPDYMEAARHLSLLDPNASAFTFQLIPKAKGDAAPIFNGSLDALCAELFDANERGDGVYVTVNETDLKGRRRENMRRIRAVWVDHDAPGVPLATFPLEPSFVVNTSANKFQCYWLVDGLSFEQHRAVMRRMVADYGSDRNAADVPRVLRLAGSLHTKGAPFLVRITAESGARYTPEEIIAAFPPVEAAPVERVARVGTASAVSALECARIGEALAPVAALEYGDWLSVGMALYHRFDGDGAGCQLWDDWSATAPNYDADVIDDKWNTFRAEPGQTPVTIGTLYDLAAASGWQGVPWQVQEALGDPAAGMGGYESMGGTPPASPGVASPARRTRLKFPSEISLDGILARERTALVKGMLYPRQLGVLYGDPKAGKTFAALDLGWHIALGRTWHGNEVKQAPVLYVSLEGNDGFEKRQVAALKAHGDPGKFFARCIAPVSLVRAETGAAGVGEVVATANELSESAGTAVRLIVVDTLARAMAGDDENSTDGMMAFVEHRLAAIQAQTGAMVLIVHHTNKEGGMRGSIALFGALDVLFRVDLSSDKNKPGVRTLALESGKDVEARTILDYRLVDVEIGSNDDGTPIKSAIVSPIKAVRTPALRADMDVVLAVLTERDKAPSAQTSGSQNLSAYVAARLIERSPAFYPDNAAKGAAIEAINALAVDGEIERFEEKGPRWRRRRPKEIYPPMPT
jgi:hypothetical protein